MKRIRKSALAIALVFCVAGAFVPACATQSNQVRAGSDRVLELRVYHAVPGKVPALEERFRDAAPLIAKHDLQVVGYWVPVEGGTYENTFVWIVAHRSREEAKKNWREFHADPAFQKYIKSEQAEKLIEKVDVAFMRPTDFSQLR
jgi:hypothetical protein